MIELWPRYQLDDETAETIEGLRPVLDATERQAELDRQLPEEAAEALRTAGLWQTTTPRELGGREVDPLLEFEIVEAVSRISTVAGWTTFVVANHTALPLAYVGDEAVEAMFAGGTPPVVGGQLLGAGKGVAVDGGYLVNGVFSWGSGIAHSNWVLCGCQVDMGDGGDPAPIVMVAPRDQFELLDNWYMSGMAGTGSFDYRATDVFVPEAFGYHAFEAKPRRGGWRFNTPLLTFACGGHSALALGAAERALELVSEMVPTKRRMLDPTIPVGERGAVQRDLGTAYHRLRAARTHMVDLLGREPDIDWDDAEVAREMESIVMAAATQANDVAYETAQLAYKYGGASAARLDQPLQRILRDIQVAKQHGILDDALYEATGRWLMAKTGARAAAVR